MAYSERYKKFVAAKEAAGDFTELAKQEKLPWVYFNEQGSILGLTVELIERDGWLKHQFKWEQVEMIKDNNWNRYIVRVDPIVENLYSIEAVPDEAPHIDTESHDLHLIPLSIDAPDVVVEVCSDSITVYLFKEIDAVTSTELVFFVTATDDPHTYLWDFTVSLSELITRHVWIETPADFSQASVFTTKVFDKYQRT